MYFNLYTNILILLALIILEVKIITATYGYYRPRIGNRMLYLVGLTAFVAMLIVLIARYSFGTSDLIVTLYYTGHLSFQQAQIGLESLGITTYVTYAILTSSSVAAAIGTGALNAIIERLLIAFLGFWGWIVLAVEITAIA